MRRAWMSWSSGKDSALALDTVRRDPSIDVTGLLVTMNEEADRVAMHAVRRELLEAQADTLGLPLHLVSLPWPCPNEVYEQRMGAAIETCLADGVDTMVFGDLFLADIRDYREAQLRDTGITPIFPLWEEPTDALASRMLDAGIDAILTCVDLAKLPASYAGRRFDHALLADLPDGVDPCGENGEFHTVVLNGPGFAHAITAHTGTTVQRDGFAFCDVIPD